MKTIRNYAKLGSVLLGVLGFAALFSSCKKEKDCACTYTYEGYTMKTTVTTNGDCDALAFSYEGEKLNMTCK